MPPPEPSPHLPRRFSIPGGDALSASPPSVLTIRTSTMNNDIPSEIIAKFHAKYDWLKNEQFQAIGDPDAKGIHQIADGIWTCHYGNTANPRWCGCTIVVRAGEAETREVHGKICERWLQEGGALGWLGYPTSDEDKFMDDGDPLDRISHFENGDIICTSKTVSTRIVNIKDRAKWYSHRHSQLLDLLRESVEATKPEERHNEALRIIEEKCIEDQFDIVLLGEFQDGKSTTFDVLCGGRELSPQGNGIKSTSAVPVSVQSLSKGETEEWGEIKFKSKEELSGEVYDTFADALQGDDIADGVRPLLQFVIGKEDEAGSRRDFFKKNFDFDNPEHLSFLTAALQNEWQRYKKARQDFATRYRQHMEALTLVARYWNSPEMAERKNKQRCPVSEIGQYVLFPKDWKSRSVLGFQSDISPSESMFAFVESAVLHLKSNFLDEIGCRVTDCPGLGASAYDTDVARRALAHADGIWFVKRCEGRQLSETDLGTVYELVKGTNRLSRTCFGLNLWKVDMRDACEDSEDEGKSIVNYCIDQLRTAGNDFPVFWFHVLFAYLSELGKRRLQSEDGFTSSERKWLAKLARLKDEQCEHLADGVLWMKAVQKANAQPGVFDVMELCELNDRAVATLWRVSNFRKAISEIAATVLRERANSILIANGTEKAQHVLRRHEDELEQVELDAARKEQECQDEVNHARKLLEDFDRKVTEKINDSVFVKTKEEEANRLSRELVDLVFADEFFVDLSKKMAAAVYKANNEYSGIWPSSYKRKIVEETTPHVENLFMNRTMSILRVWRNKGTGAGNAWSLFLDCAVQLNKEIFDLRNNLLTENPIFKNLPIPSIDNEIQNELLEMQIGNPVDSNVQSALENLRTGFWGSCWKALVWLISIGGRIFGNDESNIKQSYADTLLPKLRETFSYEDRERIVKQFSPGFSRVIEKMRGQLEEGRKDMQRDFEARCEKKVSIHNQSFEHKRKVAQDNHRLRTEVIAPLRERIGRFQEILEQELPR